MAQTDLNKLILSIKNECKDISDLHGSFFVDVRIDIIAQHVSWHVQCRDYSNDNIIIEAVANNHKSLVENLKKAFKEYPEKRVGSFIVKHLSDAVKIVSK